jgi:type IV secretory pathway VirD2 relaxase
LKELEKTSNEMLNEMKSNNDSFKAEFVKAREDIRHMLSEIGSKIR